MLEVEPDDSKLRRKRPERQLYVPPAQRKSSLNESHNIKNKQGQRNYELFKKEKVTEITRCENNLDHSGTSSDSQVSSDSTNANKSIFEFLLCSYFLQSRWKCLISGTHLKFNTNFDNHYQNEHCAIEHFLLQIPLVLFYSYNTYLHQEKNNNYEKYFCTNAFPFYTVKKEFQYTYFNQIVSKPSLVSDYYKSYLDISKQFYIFCDYDMYRVGNSVFIDNSYKYFSCLHIILECIRLEKNTHIFDITDNISETSNSIIPLPNNNDASASENTQHNEIQELKHVNIKKRSQNISSEKPLTKKILKEKTDHEEEVEIMKKTKEHINRKTRPIIKYVGETNDTLNIGNDSVKSWEDLFDDEGELKEELLPFEKLQKLKTNSKSKSHSSELPEDINHIEELEHMVELYDFPSSFKTQDLIQAFSTIQCDGMYIKWVDDTHAILVLGTLTQARKATGTNNPLIKVRPIAAASKNTLAIAYKNDLKPAMKRPPTNLQTARRFITAALGTKIGVSKEKMAKEREDLKAAREMKKMMKKNERDAWEGNLQSSLQ